MKYSFNIQANDSKQDYTEKLVLGAFNNEAGTHIALKLLAYLMFIKKRPRIDEDAGWHVVPDLIARNDAGEIILWVDCGSVSEVSSGIGQHAVHFAGALPWLSWQCAERVVVEDCRCQLLNLISRLRSGSRPWGRPGVGMITTRAMHLHRRTAPMTSTPIKRAVDALAASTAASISMTDTSSQQRMSA